MRTSEAREIATGAINDYTETQIFTAIITLDTSANNARSTAVELGDLCAQLKAKHYTSYSETG